MGIKTSPEEGYASYFDKSTEVARPGYYAMNLEEGIKVELTSTARAGMHRYTWQHTDSAHVILDLHHRDFLLDADIQVESNTMITGFRSSKAWADDQRIYFCMEFSKPMTSSYFNAGHIQPTPDQADKTTTNGALFFDIADGEELLIRIGIFSSGCRRSKKESSSRDRSLGFRPDQR